MCDFSFDLKKKQPKRYKAILAMSPFEGPKIPIDKKKKEKSVTKKKTLKVKKNELAVQENQKELKESTSKKKGLNESRMGQTSFD